MRVVMALPVHRRLDQILFFHRIPLLAVVAVAPVRILMLPLAVLAAALDERVVLVAGGMEIHHQLIHRKEMTAVTQLVQVQAVEAVPGQ